MIISHLLQANKAAKQAARDWVLPLDNFEDTWRHFQPSLVAPKLTIFHRMCKHTRDLQHDESSSFAVVQKCTWLTFILALRHFSAPNFASWFFKEYWHWPVGYTSTAQRLTPKNLPIKKIPTRKHTVLVGHKWWLRGIIIVWVHRLFLLFFFLNPTHPAFKCQRIKVHNGPSQCSLALYS